jgi:hypothetical protein
LKLRQPFSPVGEIEDEQTFKEHETHFRYPAQCIDLVHRLALRRFSELIKTKTDLSDPFMPTVEAAASMLGGGQSLNGSAAKTEGT